MQFLKLGGSLITEKTRPHTPRPEVLARLAGEIAAAWKQASWQQAAWQQQPGMRLVLGHGSGSYGHVPARRYGTRQGVRTQEEWGGFIEVWREAAALNRLVVDALGEAGLPAMAFPPSAGLTAQDGRLAAWDLSALHAAVQAGLLPVVYGDVVFDFRRGGTIFSTEDLFEILASELKPGRLLLAGLEAGVWLDYPERTRLVRADHPGKLPADCPGSGRFSGDRCDRRDGHQGGAEPGAGRSNSRVGSVHFLGRAAG